MSRVEGVVEKISRRGKAFNVNVDGEWYGAGFEEPDFDEGDTIEFRTKRRGDFVNLDPDTVEVVDSGGPRRKSKSNGRSGGKSYSSSKKGSSYGDTQKSINWQAARNSAITVLQAAVEQGMVSLPAAKAKKLDAFLALVDEVSERYYNDTAQVASTGKAPARDKAEDVDTDEDEDELEED